MRRIDFICGESVLFAQNGIYLRRLEFTCAVIIFRFRNGIFPTPTEKAVTPHCSYIPIQHTQAVQDHEDRTAFMADDADGNCDGLHEVQDQQHNDDAD